MPNDFVNECVSVRAAGVAFAGDSMATKYINNCSGWVDVRLAEYAAKA
jgi:hypothetical protein